MSDYTKSKSFPTTTYPIHANGTSGLLKRVEPLLTPEKLKSRHLKGVLELAKRFGITYTNDELKDRINLATNQTEIELGVPIFAEQFKEKHPFDVNLYRAFIHIRTEQGPIVSLEDFSIVSSDQQTIFNVPIQWVETAQFHQRQINVIPLLSNFGGTTVNTPVASGGIAYLSILLNQFGFIPSYWQVTYTAGVCKDPGCVPVVVNELIGTIAAMEMLSSIAPNNLHTSVSLSQDGIGQSSSNPGPQLFQMRMQELEAKKKTLMGQIKRVFSAKYFLSNI
jgi:hypothetical protein